MFVQVVSRSKLPLIRTLERSLLWKGQFPKAMLLKPECACRSHGDFIKMQITNHYVWVEPETQHF